MGFIIVRTLSKAFSKVVTFSGVFAVRVRPVDFRFSADPVPLKLVTHNKIGFRDVTGLSIKIEVQKKRLFCCSYRVVYFDKRFNNESAMLTSPNHGSERKKVQFMAAKETKNNGIIKKQNIKKSN